MPTFVFIVLLVLFIVWIYTKYLPNYYICKSLDEIKETCEHFEKQIRQVPIYIASSKEFSGLWSGIKILNKLAITTKQKISYVYDKKLLRKYYTEMTESTNDSIDILEKICDYWKKRNADIGTNIMNVKASLIRFHCDIHI